MSSALIDHSEDLQQLWKEGYELIISEGSLLVKNIPYLDAQQHIRRGIIVTPLDQSGDKTVKPQWHAVYFAGEIPCAVNGASLNIYVGSSDQVQGGITVNHTLSAKADYRDYYEKITRYVHLLMAPAHHVDDSVKATLFEVVEPVEEDSVFHYADTNAARAGINVHSAKLMHQKIGIVGLGGTGSYILDFIAKTPVAEIHLFDDDIFLNHNAFRAPGAIEKKRFYEHLLKVDYFKSVYDRMHKHIFARPYAIDEKNVTELAGIDYIFLNMDSGPAKRSVIAFLEQEKITFIHCGLSIEDIDGEGLKGQVRVTSSTEGSRGHVNSRVSYADPAENLYDRNIQIAELNAFNAAMAVIKWKKMCGFYKDHEREMFSSYMLYTNEIINDDFPT